MFTAEKNMPADKKIGGDVLQFIFDYYKIIP